MNFVSAFSISAVSFRYLSIRVPLTILESTINPYSTLMPLLFPRSMRTIPAMYGLNMATPLARVFIVAIPTPLFPGSKLSARIADIGGNWKTMNPCSSAPRAIHSQLGAKT
ncbi:hypothetical protein ES703_07926 [subsurface metagenome]